jgi:hypothetical protein
MKLKLLVVAVAAAFALPVYGAGDKATSAESATPSASQGASASGAAAMFKSLDKNSDGFLSREEVQGSPHEKDFATLDKNNDGKLSSEEHAAAKEHMGDKAGTGATGSGAAAPSGGSSSGSGGGTKY